MPTEEFLLSVGEIHVLLVHRMNSVAKHDSRRTDLVLIVGDAGWKVGGRVVNGKDRRTRGFRIDAT